MSSIATEFLRWSIDTFRSQKYLAERAITQLDDAQIHQTLHPETNSVAVIMKHMAGNMHSRWTDFLTSDGEKPDRHRDAEFIDDIGGHDEIMAQWEAGWACLFDAMEVLSVEDLDRTVTIRGHAHSVPHAILRQISHYGYHVGQIVQLARALVGDDPWVTLSIPRGGSEEFNESSWGKPYRPHHDDGSEAE